MCKEKMGTRCTVRQVERTRRIVLRAHAPDIYCRKRAKARQLSRDTCVVSYACECVIFVVVRQSATCHSRKRLKRSTRSGSLPAHTNTVRDVRG